MKIGETCDISNSNSDVILVSVSTVMGCMETLGASIVDEYPSMRQYKPAIVFTIMSGIFMINLVMATKGKIQ